MSTFIPPTATTTVRTGLTLEAGEIVYDSDEKRMYMGDGVTAGGKKLYTAADIPVENTTLRIDVGPSRSITIITQALDEIKKHSLGVGVDVLIVLDAGEYSFPNMMEGYQNKITFTASGASEVTINGGISEKNITECLLIRFVNLNIESVFNVYNSNVNFENCDCSSSINAYQEAHVFLDPVRFSKSTLDSNATALTAHSRSYVLFEEGSITNYGKGIQAYGDAYVDVSGTASSSKVTFTGVTTPEIPAADTVDYSLDNAGFIRDPYRKTH